MVAVRLKKTHLLDKISDRRCIVGVIVKTRSCPSIGPPDSLTDINVNPYSDNPSEATRGDIQEETKVTD